MANYLYNGIELPPLPVRDETVLPYAAIGKPGFVEPPEGEKYLFFCSEQINYTTLVGALLPTKGKGYVYKYTKEAGTWEKYDDWGFPDSTFPTSECSITRVDWSNYNILNTDGSVYLAASDPIPILAPVIDPLSLFLGWRAGNWVARQRGKKREPVAYLYNGVKLPGLPEWDKVNNPCAAIMRIEVDGTAHALLAVAQYADSRFAIGNNKYGDPIVMVKVSGYYVGINSFNCIAMFYVPLSGGEWAATTESFSCNAEDLIWSNFDVADARTDDGTVFLAASDPIPVYE